MKTQVSKPARSKARYTEEYKKEALQWWRASGRSAAKVAAELGIRAPLLYRWAQLERQPEAAAAESKAARTVAELDAENAKLLEQREVLKKSLGILSEAPPRRFSRQTEERGPRLLEVRATKSVRTFPATPKVVSTRLTHTAKKENDNRRSC